MRTNVVGFNRASYEAPRILIVSQRGMHLYRSRCLPYEFEDLVQSVDAVDMLAPTEAAIRSARLRRFSRAIDAIAPGEGSRLATDLPDLRHNYDLLVVSVETPGDLTSLPSIPWLVRHAKVTVCIVDDLYRRGLEQRTGELRLLSHFDRIFLSCEGSVAAVGNATGRPCQHLAPSVDALTLCPYPQDVPRAIDVYWMGRRSPQTHQALLDWSHDRRRFYLYDTAGNASVRTHQEHRRHLGDLIRRTKWFVVNAGKVDEPEMSGGQQEVGARFFEGAAGGTVMFGDPPRTEGFSRLFDWPDAVIPLPHGSRDVASVLEPLEADPARMERIRRENVVQSLLRHDHIYRWAEILSATGLGTTPRIEERKRALKALAETVAQGARDQVDASGIRTAVPA